MKRLELTLLALALFTAPLVTPGSASAADLTLRVNDLDALPGTQATLEIRTYSPRPVSQGQICFRSRSVAARRPSGAASGAANSPFAALLGGRVFSQAGDVVAQISTLQQGTETVWMVEFDSPSASVNAVDGPMIELDFELRSDLALGEEFEVFVDLSNTSLFGPGTTPLDLRSEPGRVRIRADDDLPSSLGFTSATFSASEDVGQAVVTVARTGNDDGAVSVSYLAREGSATAADFVPTQGTLQWPSGDLSVKSFTVGLTRDSLEEPLETLQLLLMSPTGGATLAQSVATLEIADSERGAPTPSDDVLLLPGTVSVLESQPSVRLRAIRRGSASGARNAVVRTVPGSAVAGEDYDPVDLALSWAAGETGERVVDIPLLDDALDEGNETFTVQLLEGQESLATSRVTILDNDAVTGLCTPSSTVLCLLGGRFEVSLRWHLSDGAAGSGQAASLGPASGTFWFFDPSNVEMLVKVLDGCSVPGLEGYWVFAAATTDVGYQLEVKDLETGVSRSYENIAGQPALPIQDTGSFPTCP